MTRSSGCITSPNHHLPTTMFDSWHEVFFFSFQLLPSEFAAANHLPPSNPVLCNVFSNQLTLRPLSLHPQISLLVFLLASHLVVPTSLSSLYQYIHYPSSVHVQTISVWSLTFFPKHITCCPSDVLISDPIHPH